MCGRARCSLAPEQVRQAAGIDQRGTWVNQEQYRPSYNVSPGHWMPIVHHNHEGAKQLQTMKWGLVPSFTAATAQPDHYRMFNARAEGLLTKPIFSRLVGPYKGSSKAKTAHHKAESASAAAATASDDEAEAAVAAAYEGQEEGEEAVAHKGTGSSSSSSSSGKRCVVVMNGFYEWKAEGARKQPYYIHRGEEEPLLCAGLYDTWKDAEGAVLPTFTIITVDASKRISWLHNRMPAILAGAAEVAAWLGEGQLPGGTGGSSTDPAALVEQVCQPYNESDLVWHPVTTAMSKPSYQEADACADVRTKKGTITALFGAAKAKPKSVSKAEKGDAGAGTSAGVQDKQEVSAAFEEQQVVEAVKEEEKSNQAAAVACGLNADDKPEEVAAAGCKEEKQQRKEQDDGAAAGAGGTTAGGGLKPKKEQPGASLGGSKSAADHQAAGGSRPRSQGKRKQPAAAAGRVARGRGRSARGKKQKQH